MRRRDPICRLPVFTSVLAAGLFAGLASLADAQSVSSFQQQADGVTFSLSGSRTMKLEIYAPNIVRVVYKAGAAVPAAKGYVVVRDKPSSSSFTVADASSAVSIATSRMAISVNKANAAVTYLSGGATVCAEKSGGKSIGGETGMYSGSVEFDSPADEGIYGFGQQQNGLMNQRGASFAMVQENTSDVVPFFTSTRGYGVLYNCYSRGQKTAPVKMSLDRLLNDALDYFFIYGPEIDTVIAGYRWLTGAAPLNGKWAYGYWQSKCRYETQSEILNVVSSYRQNGIPLDNIVVDWEYWNPQPWGSHYFNSTDWPNPTQMNAALHATHNAHSMISVWGYFQSGSANYSELNAANCLIDNYYNPVSSSCASIYWRQIKDQIMSKGFDALWLDATEPESNWDKPEYGNIYSLMSTKCAYEGHRAAFPQRRVYTLSRSVYAGQQRYGAACWTGDIEMDWAAYKDQIPSGLNYCNSGLPYWCTDIGGFEGGTRTNETFIRWFQYGAFCPIFRVHGTQAPVIYSFGTAAERAILVTFDKLRYRLMPYVYSLAWKVTSEGYTVMRALPFDFRTDPAARNIADQFMYGPAFLVSPVTTAGATTRQVYLPSGTWYDFWTGAQVNGGATVTAAAPLDKMPLHIRAGSILPMGPEIQYAAESADPIELRVYTGADGKFTVYEDENDGYAYEQGTYATIPITWTEATQNLTIGARQGNFPGMLGSRTFNVVWVSQNHGVGEPVTASVDKTVAYTGSAVTVNKGSGQVAGQGFPRAEVPRSGGRITVESGRIVLTGPSLRPAHITVTDMTGRRVVSQGIAAGVRTFETRPLPRGSYLVRWGDVASIVVRIAAVM